MQQVTINGLVSECCMSNRRVSNLAEENNAGAAQGEEQNNKGKDKMHGHTDDKICPAIVALQKLCLHTEGLVRDQAAATQSSR